MTISNPNSSEKLYTSKDNFDTRVTSSLTNIKNPIEEEEIKVFDKSAKKI